MAQVNIVKRASMMVVVAVALTAATTVSAQAPAPSPDVGAAFSLPTSGVMIATSLLLSFVALLKNWFNSYVFNSFDGFVFVYLNWFDLFM